MEAKIANIKISIPLTKWLKNSEYHSNISMVFQPLGEISDISNSLNLQDDNPTILSISHVDEPFDEEVSPSMLAQTYTMPFYITSCSTEEPPTT